jgi:hypothetical protein
MINNAELPIRVVCATRQPRNKFLTQTLLGNSVSNYIQVSKAEVRLYAENSSGLSKVYNQAIEESISKPAILVFVHDDVLLCDFFWGDRIRDGLSKFDIIGIAGNTRRLGNQPSWAYFDKSLTWDDPANLSGAFASPCDQLPLSRSLKLLGPPGQECKILDGVLLAVNSETLNQSHLRFDENFDFHFYDVDFCRQAESKNLKMGTIPLSIGHESAGNFNSDSWKKAYSTYCSKWGE